MTPQKFFDLTCVGREDAFADERSLPELLDILLANPLAPVTRMDLAERFEFTAPVESEAVVRRLARPLSATKHGRTVVYLAADDRRQLWGSLARHRDRCAVSLTFAASLVPERLPVAGLVAFAEAVWRAMPARSHMSVKPDTEYQDVMLAAGLSFVTPLFLGHVGWLHWLDPVAYAQWYEKEDLLRAPAARVEAQAFDAVFLQAFADPWQYTEATTHEQLRRLEHHLGRTRKTGGVRMA